MRRIAFIVFLISILFLQEVHSQRWKRYRREFFGGGVVSTFLGELGGRDAIGTSSIRDFDSPSIRPGGTIGYSYRLANRVAWQTRVTFAYLNGNDANTKEDFRSNRNLHFRSPLAEATTQIDFFIFTKKKRGNRYSLRGIRGRRKANYTVYVFAGIGGFWFDPSAKWPEEEGGDGKWHRLKPLKTEGQGLVPTRKNYSSYQFCVPYGIGIKYDLNRQLSLGIEYGYRRSFTDYIDDVSTSYMDPDVIYEGNGGADGDGAMAVYLANPSPDRDTPRFDENGNQNHPYYGITSAGNQRGDPRDSDTYMLATITLYYKLPRRGFSIPKF